MNTNINVSFVNYHCYFVNLAVIKNPTRDLLKKIFVAWGWNGFGALSETISVLFYLYIFMFYSTHY